MPLNRRGQKVPGIWLVATVTVIDATAQKRNSEPHESEDCMVLGLHLLVLRGPGWSVSTCLGQGWSEMPTSRLPSLEKGVAESHALVQ